LRSISDEQARTLLTARNTARVQRQRVSHYAKWLVAPEMHDLVGEEVQAAFTPHDDRAVEIYRRGHLVCIAFPQDAISAEQQQQIVTERRICG
jgi:Mu transposase, C-terminal